MIDFHLAQNYRDPFGTIVVSRYRMHTAMSLGEQFGWLVVLAIPVACLSWTCTHEEIFREPREFCIKRSKESIHLFTRKFFYVFTCEYCFSHYVSILILLLTHFKMLYTGWRGYAIAWLCLVWIANIYMSLFALLRAGIKSENTDIALKEEIIDKEKGTV